MAPSSIWGSSIARISAPRTRLESRACGLGRGSRISDQNITPLIAMDQFMTSYRLASSITMLWMAGISQK